MERTLAKDLHRRLDETVRIRGWLHALRPLGKLNFLIVRDGSGLSQVVISDREELKKVHGLQPGTILTVVGTAKRAPQAALGVEVVDPLLTVEQAVLEAPPVEYYKPEIPSDLEFILDNRTLALRNRRIQAVFKIQAEIAHAYTLYMHGWEKAVEYFPPLLIGASSEGGAEFFSVDYFGHEATLAQSSQLYKQILVGVNEKVYATVPFFRAEPSHTTRHLTEGRQLEFEVGFFENWQEILDIEEKCLKFMLTHLKTYSAAELELLGHPLPEAPDDVSFPRIPFAEAQQIYYERTGVDERDELDLSPAAEREIGHHVKEYFKTDFVFITDWKREKRPFYSFPSETDPSLTNTFDLLCRGTEITSGGQRRHTYDLMMQGLLDKGMNPDRFLDYLAIFKYGMPPHGGFGIGLERLTMTFLGLKNIREASLFPSDPKRIASNRIKAKIVFGGENLRCAILHVLKEKGISFQHLVHGPTPTCEDSARLRGTRMEEGVKTLIVKGVKSKKNALFNIPSHLKLDMKAVQEAMGEKCSFEEIALIKERFGLEAGGIPPFGNLLNLDTYFDNSLKQMETSAFNCGLPTESLILKTQDLIALIDPRFGPFAIPK
ncbi:MAG: aspartate--tRNA(Asn) ligase [Chlamydiae bacterium RIFCSPHIGHO2_02_FULL_49_29]|nr:MAG: aspartate--tRNA(Asn) ligase [Chlamydiae bacterium RIFCSPHIGHO2_02_FULL_49_29]